MVGKKTSAKSTPIALPEGATTLKASAHLLCGEESGPGKARLQESYYKWYTFISERAALQEAIEQSKENRKVRYAVALAPTEAAVDVPSPALKLVRTPTSTRGARRVVAESSGAGLGQGGGDQRQGCKRGETRSGGGGGGGGGGQGGGGQHHGCKCGETSSGGLSHLVAESRRPTPGLQAQRDAQ